MSDTKVSSGAEADNHENGTKSDLEAEKPTDELVSTPMYKLEVDEEGKVKGEKQKVEEKVVTSMYGKVYKLKPGATT